MALHNTSPYTNYSFPYGPMGFKQYKVYYHYRPVYPTSLSGAHLNLHKSLPPRIKPKFTPDSEKLTKTGVKVLEKQRPRIQHFIGIKEMKKEDVETISDRLAKYDPVRFPAEGRGLVSLPSIDLCQRSKRVYKGEDVQRIVERLATNQSLDKSQTKELEDKITEGSSQKKMKPAELDALVKRLSSYDPEVGPAMSRGMSARKPDLTDLVKRSKSAKPADIDKIVERLAKYDIEKWPPGSPGKSATEPPASSAGKKFSPVEVEQVVERLSTYNKSRWPAESVGTKSEFYKGKPLKFKNH